MNDFTKEDSCILYHDDCFNVFPMLDEGSIDLVLCDMPYGTIKCKWDTVISLEKMWRELKRICKPDVAIVLTACQPFTSLLTISNIKNYKYCWYWNKSRATGHLNSKKMPLKNIEEILVFCYGKKPYNPIFREGKPYKGRGGSPKDSVYSAHTSYREDNPGIIYPRQLLEFKSVNKPQHPTQKPVELMEYLIKTYSNEGNAVLDFCMGSGTTGIACKNLNRKFIGIEKEQKYFEIAVNRINGEIKPDE